MNKKNAKQKKVGNKYYRKKTSEKKAREVVDNVIEDIKVTQDEEKEVDLNRAIDELLDEEIDITNDDSSTDKAIEFEELIPPENSLIEESEEASNVLSMESFSNDIEDTTNNKIENDYDALQVEEFESLNEQEISAEDDVNKNLDFDFDEFNLSENNPVEDNTPNEELENNTDIDKLIEQKIFSTEELNSLSEEKANLDNDIINNVTSDVDSYTLEKQEENEVQYQTSNNSNGLYLSYNVRLFSRVAGIIIFIILAIFLLLSSISIKARSSILYNQSSNLDYKVYLKPNEYYKEPYLSKNMQYIASLIDNVDVDFNYNFMVNQNIDYKYTYYIKADVAVTDTQDKTKIIYSKSDKLTEPRMVTKDSSSGFTIIENVKIDYAKYNDLVKAFKSSYGINADSSLVLSLCVEIEDMKGNVIKSANDPMSIIIPLTEQMIDIKMDSKELNNSNNVNVYKDFSISNKVTLTLSVISLITAIIFIVNLFAFLKKTSTKKTIYDVTLSKILREYDRVIVNSKKMVDFSTDIVDVNSFNELLDVRDNIEKPIIFSEVHKGQKSIFIVKTGNETYRYILKLVDLEKEQEVQK